MENDSLLLTSKMLHDIRNRLNTIVGYSQILLDEDAMPEEYKKMLTSITNSATEIQTLLLKRKENVNNDKKTAEKESDEMIKILIVDDNEDNLDILDRLLRKHPLMVYIAKSGNESVKIAKEEKPHLIFMDMHLPDISGKEASQLIKQDHPTAKIVALTGDINALEHEKNTQSVFDVCLAKPFDRNEIKELINLLTSSLVDEMRPEHKLSEDYLTELISCAKVGRINCMEDIIEKCEDTKTQEFLKNKLTTFQFEEIVLWAQKVKDEYTAG